MRILHLVRHAKAVRDPAVPDDHGRPLTPRGRRDGDVMAARFRGTVVDLALVSDARRTRETWARLAPSLGGDPEVSFEAGLYLCGPDGLLDRIRAIPDRVSRAIVVGHNPDLEICAGALAGSELRPGALARLREKFPTGAWAEIHLDVGGWDEVAPGRGRLVRLVRPRLPDA